MNEELEHGTALAPRWDAAGLITAVVWVKRGVVTAVAGSLDSNEVMSVARAVDQA